MFLGLTVGCAVCHDHKFDPVPQKDFYRLMAYFNSAADAAMDGNAVAPPPIIQTPTPEDEAKRKALDLQIAGSERRLPRPWQRFLTPIRAPETRRADGPREFVWIDDALPAGAQAPVVNGISPRPRSRCIAAQIASKTPIRGSGSNISRRHRPA